MQFKQPLFLLLFTLTFTSLQAQCWNLIWEDEFTGTTLNTDNWSYQIGASGWGNNELQYYTDHANNVAVSDGTLKITAQEESFLGSNYTSARIRTINKVDWTYGKMEARIKLPEGQGIWPAFWMMPTDSEYGGWPASGEIDIMEFLGHQTATTHGTVHYGYAGNHQFNGDQYTLPSSSFSGAFHDFVVEWEADEIRWYVDGLLFNTITEADLGAYPWVFDKNFHFILNLAVGGNWPGSPDGTTVFPQTMEVDYVRVYQKTADLQIAGDNYVQPSEVGVQYEAPLVTGATYNWTIPTGASIQVGQGTNTIEVDWGATSGNISCTITTACGTETIPFSVQVSPNFFKNPAFESEYSNWNTNAHNGATADFTISTDSQEGIKSAQIDVTSGGTNNWDIQLQRNGFALEAGQEYSLSFYAKAGTDGLQVPIFIVKNQSPWNAYANTTITLSENWMPYEMVFTASATDNVLMNVDLGNQSDVFFFDNFIFGRTETLLPVELGAFTARETANRKVLLEWVTYSEVDNAYFEILRRDERGNFYSIGRVDGQGTSNERLKYQFTDKTPLSNINYYQLRQVDLDGRFSLSPIISVQLEKENSVRLSPNPVTDLVQLEGWKGGLIQIIDLQGRELYRKLLIANNGISSFSMETFSDGIYFLKLEDVERPIKVIKN